MQFWAPRLHIFWFEPRLVFSWYLECCISSNWAHAVCHLLALLPPADYHHKLYLPKFYHCKSILSQEIPAVFFQYIPLLQIKILCNLRFKNSVSLILALSYWLVLFCGLFALSSQQVIDCKLLEGRGCFVLLKNSVGAEQSSLHIMGAQ